MIYTVTFNPSLDYVIQTENLRLGEISRTTSEAVYPGGKGINVSVVLKSRSEQQNTGICGRIYRGGTGKKAE